MLKRFGVGSVVFSLWWVGMGCLSLQAQELDEGNYQKLLKELKPAADALWRTIPWKTALLDAQQTAARERKPIFIWAMDGHPLGCT